ncbi:hypothetical protein C8R45DRAFT_933050 [Mycena sanguinolenta]|nr:hypothetical protein C8R45DRAFT_933050 [Mycena sanguinolenta]
MQLLAIIYKQLRKIEEAKKLQVAMLEKGRKLLGDDHLDTLTAMNNLGWTYYHQGHFIKTEDLQIVVLGKRRTLLGDGHPHTQHAMQNLASTYHSLGKKTEVVEIERLIHN